MRKLLILLLATILLFGCTRYKDGEPVNQPEDEDQTEEVENNEQDSEEVSLEEKRIITDSELEIWENEDKPYFTNDEYFRHIDDIELDKHFEHVTVHVNKDGIRPFSSDQLYDYTNETGESIQEVIQTNYGVEDIQVYFYVDDELISKQNEHGVWVNHKMTNWDE